MGSNLDMTIYEMQAEVSKTMAHPLRLAILHYLKDGEKTVNDITQITGASQSNVSQHLALLRQRQIVKTRKEGSNIYYSCLLYTSPSPRDGLLSRMPSSA